MTVTDNFDTTDLLTLTPEFEAAMTETNGATDAPADDTDDSTDDATTFEVETVQPGRVVHTVLLEKNTSRIIDDNKSDLSLAEIVGSVPTSALARGWTIEYAVEKPEPVYHTGAKREISSRYVLTGDRSTGWLYSVTLIVSCKPKTVRSTLPMEFSNIVAALHARGQYKQHRWSVTQIDGRPYVPAEVEKIVPGAADEIGYVPFEMPAAEIWLSDPDPTRRNGTGAFDHLYGLDDYIEIMRSTIELGELSGWRDRVNIAFIGPPACGKSDLLKSLKECVGEDAVLEFDATSTTMAGAQQELYEREELPRILLIEEIEKAPQEALQWLLSILDLRGEIRKRTAKTQGMMAKNIHMVGICTVNNREKFQEMAAGALQSRFSLQLEFTRPPREILWKILEREVKKIGGDYAWIDPALDFADEVSKLDPDGIDPRRLIAICLTGREKLIDGSYQAMLRRTMRSTFKRIEAVGGVKK